MNSLLSALHDMLCFITEDARAHKFPGIELIPKELMELMNKLCIELGVYLDGEDRNLRIIDFETPPPSSLELLVREDTRIAIDESFDTEPRS